MNPTNPTSQPTPSQSENENPTSQNGDTSPRANQPRTVSAGEWLRLTTDFNAPFGHDRMPTVWG